MNLGAKGKQIQSEREVFIAENTKAALQPLTIQSNPDGGVLVAGTSSAIRQAWAAKLGVDGNLVWFFSHGLPAVVAGDRPRPLSEAPAFIYGESSPDGHVSLCGNTYERAFLQSGILVALEANGTPLAVKGFRPDAGAFAVFACSRSTDGFLVVGTHGNKLAVASLDSSGGIRWTLDLPRQEGDPLAPGCVEGTSVRRVGEHWVVVATDNSNTIVASVTSEGELTSRRNLGGRYVLVNSPDFTNFKLFGGPTRADLPRSLLFMNDHLEITHSTEGPAPSNFAPRSVFEMTDGRLLMFGSAIRMFGERLRSAAVYVAPDLSSNVEMEFDNHGRKDSGSVWAAARTKDPHLFVTARLIVDPDKFGDANSVPSEEFVNGAVVNFVRVE